MTNFDMIGLLRQQFVEILKGPGVSWNKQGIEHTFDKAVAAMALKALDQKQP